MTSPKRDEIPRKTAILRIHGTFAADPSDSGQGWWQRGSNFQIRLQQELGESADFSTGVFHWSGANSAKARSDAGRRLLNHFVLPLERSGRPYTLIGHSHGGSVIHEMVCYARNRGIALRHISVISVGTPFFRRAVPWSTALYIVPLTLAATQLLGGLKRISPLGDYLTAIEEEGDLAGAISAIALALVLALVTIGLTYAIGRTFWSWLTASARHERSVRRELGGGTSNEPQSVRWLSIASNLDEAITGLNFVCSLKQRLLPELAYPLPPRRGAPWLWALCVPILPVLLGMSGITWFYNKILEPWLLRPLLNQVLRGKALGEDQGGIETIDVESHFASASRVQVDLSDLHDAANQNLANLVPTLRSEALNIFRPAFAHQEGELHAFRSLSTGLVHCGYFDDDTVLRAIVGAVRGTTKRPSDIATEMNTPGPRRFGWRWRLPMTALMTAAVALLGYMANQFGTAYIYRHTDEALIRDLVENHPLVAPSADGDPMDESVRWLEAMIGVDAMDAYLATFQATEAPLQDVMARRNLRALIRHGGLATLKRVPVSWNHFAEGVLAALLENGRLDEARAWAMDPLGEPSNSARMLLMYAASSPEDGEALLSALNSYSNTYLEPGSAVDPHRRACPGSTEIDLLGHLHSGLIRAKSPHEQDVRSLLEYALTCVEPRSRAQVHLELMGAFARKLERKSAFEELDEIVKHAVTNGYYPRMAPGRRAWASIAAIDPSAVEFKAHWTGAHVDESTRYSAWVDAAPGWLTAGHAETTVALLEEAQDIVANQGWGGGMDFCVGYKDRYRSAELELVEAGKFELSRQVAGLIVEARCDDMITLGQSWALRLAVRLYRQGNAAAGRTLWVSEKNLRARSAALLSLVVDQGAASDDMLRELVSSDAAQMVGQDLVTTAENARAAYELGEVEAAKASARSLRAIVKDWAWGQDRPDERVAVVALLARLKWYRAALELANSAGEPTAALRAQTALIVMLLAAEGRGNADFTETSW